jgi:predicted hotdog family 3-hydroxylacyl-ACP dehydratase
MDVTTLIPHTGVARFLSSIVSVTPSAIHATGAIPTAHPLAVDGAAPALLAIELGAQAAAAFEAMARQSSPGHDQGPQTGTLVRIRDAHFSRASVPVDAPIHVTAERAGASGPLAMYRLSATFNGETILTAVISTHGGQIRSAS